MYRDEISIGVFSADILSTSEYSVDINTLLGVCGASPVHVHYKTDKIVIKDTYPESIILKCGDSYICISQIQRIIRTIDDGGKIVYEIICGRLKSLEMIVKITHN